MTPHRVTRRQVLRCLGGAAAPALLGAVAVSFAPVVAAEGPASELLIDTHFHLVNPRLPGVPESIQTPDQKTRLAPFDAKNPEGAQQLAKVIQAEMKAAEVG